jgi:uncharacterized repeat protein (TIGR03847 family)
LVWALTVTVDRLEHWGTTGSESGHISDPVLCVAVRYDERMPRRLFIIDAPDRFVPGTIGEPGARTFFLQARKGEAVVSVALEKAQVAILAERLSELLEAVLEQPVAGPAPDDRPLDEPLIDLFRVGPMALAWDADSGRVVIEAQPVNDGGDYVEVPDEAEEGPDLVRVRIEPAQASEFVRRAEALIEAGRPTCPFCGEVLEASGHFCALTKAHLN